MPFNGRLANLVIDCCERWNAADKEVDRTLIAPIAIDLVGLLERVPMTRAQHERSCWMRRRMHFLANPRCLPAR